MTDKRPDATTLPHTPPFSMPSPFPAHRSPLEPSPPSRLQRAKGASVWTALGLVLGVAVQWLLASRGVPATVSDAAGRAVQTVVEQGASE